jgi:hypothetical protein
MALEREKLMKVVMKCLRTTAECLVKDTLVIIDMV